MNEDAKIETGDQPARALPLRGKNPGGNLRPGGLQYETPVARDGDITTGNVLSGSLQPDSAAILQSVESC